MRVYLAAKYNRREELRPLAERMGKLGLECTAQWIYNAEESKSQPEGAIMDADDVARADALIFFSEPKGSSNKGGGRYFEFGYAFGLGKRVISIGDHETIFQHHPTIDVVDTFDDALDLLVNPKPYEDPTHIACSSAYHSGQVCVGVTQLFGYAQPARCPQPAGTFWTKNRCWRCGMVAMRGHYEEKRREQERAVTGPELPEAAS